MPEYPGGDEARQKFIAQNIVYPPLAIENNKQGTVIIQFVVEKDGNVSNVTAYKSFDEDCSKEAIRVVKLMKWKPGEQRAIDYGTKRVGLAVTDELKIIATSLGTVHAKDVINYLKEYCTQNNVETFVVGLPKQMDGSASESE
eukprot:gene9697-12975_t